MKITSSRVAFAALLLASLPFTPPVAAQWGGKADGAVVTADILTVYEGATGDKTIGLLVKGDGVAAASDGARRFKSLEGRVRIEFVQQDGKRRRGRTGWVDANGLAQRFAYDCGCEQACWPFAEKGRDVLFNRCFQEAMVQAEVIASAAAPAANGKVIVETEFGKRVPDSEVSKSPSKDTKEVQKP